MTDIDKTIDKAKAAVLPFESWERLAGETGGAYAAFCAYRDYGPERNIRKALEAAGNKGEGGAGRGDKRYGMWRAWAAQFRWRERAAGYDQYLDRLKQREVRKTIEEQGRVHRMVTGKMLEVVTKKLEMMKAEELTQGNVKEWAEAAIRTEREIAGLSVSQGERDNGGGKQLEIQFAQEFEGL
jgi:hypothetical protein